VEQVENTVLGIENKVELEQPVKDNEKNLKHKWNMQDTWNIIKRPNL
jgi:hypothetical protein